MNALYIAALCGGGWLLAAVFAFCFAWACCIAAAWADKVKPDGEGRE